MSTKQKIGLGAYGFCVTSSFLVATYNDGKDELLKSRTVHNKYINDPETRYSYKYINDPETRYRLDWEAVRKGCSDKPFVNFWESVIFPFTLISNVMPRLVIALNPIPAEKPVTPPPTSPTVSTAPIVSTVPTVSTAPTVTTVPMVKTTKPYLKQVETVKGETNDNSSIYP
ncbi:MAG: hypothetical protein O7C56_07520 [Rickettsia endosymbiont of Ixodes persulcatus]|nr:hypothetical protein [Rickettsia endosymbiont of Ixodes persulcatus]